MHPLIPSLGRLTFLCHVRHAFAPRKVLLVIVVAASPSCGGPPDLDHELDVARSWTATVHLAGTERRAGATSARYTTQLRDRARDARRDLARSLPTAATGTGDQARARAALDSLDAALAALDAVVADR
jgi:hypothetical protein